MITKIKKIISLALILSLTGTLSSKFTKEVQANTTIPEYTDYKEAEINDIKKYKDKTIISMVDYENQDIGIFYYDGDKPRVKLTDSEYFFSYSDKKMYYYPDRSIFNMETGKNEGNYEDIRDKFYQIIENKYPNEKVGVGLFREFNGELWAHSFIRDSNYGYKKSFIVNLSGDIFEVKNEIAEIFVDDEKIYMATIQPDGVIDGKEQFEYRYVVMNKKTGAILGDYFVRKCGLYDQYVKIGKNFFFSTQVKYELINGKMVATVSDESNPLFSDENGNIYLIEGGYVKKAVAKDNYVNLYKVDKDMSGAIIYDENNMIVFQRKEGPRKYKIINHKTTENNSDWKNHWAANEIKYAMDKGWAINSNTFRPNDSIKRSEFIKLVNKAFGLTEKATSENFTDVKQGDWWYNEVLIASKAGYIDTKQTKFRPNDPITREEVASIITTIKNNKDTNIDKIKSFKDYYYISSWARTSVEGAVEAGYMGKNQTEFRPKAKITRAESVVTLYRIVNK